MVILFWMIFWIKWCKERELVFFFWKSENLVKIFRIWVFIRRRLIFWFDGLLLESNIGLISILWILWGVRKVEVCMKEVVIFLWGEFLIYLKFISYVVCIVRWFWDLYFYDGFVGCWFSNINFWFLYFLRYLLMGYWRVFIWVLVCFKVRGK